MKQTKSLLFALIIWFSSIAIVMAQETGVVQLPAPDTSGGKPLMSVFNQRCSQRNYSDRPLSLQTLSNLLWAANGINRPDSGKRTAPTAMNDQEIDVYVATTEGAYLYDHVKHCLLPIHSNDVRAKMGVQGFVKDAPIVLVYVADYKRMSKLMSKEDKNFYAATDVGFVSQNVYLFCASEGLATVVIGMVSRNNAAKALNLTEHQKIILTQCVGYSK